MSRMNCWDPVRDMLTLRQAVDRVLDELFTRGSETRGTGAWLLPMDAYITDDAIVIRADVPGIAADELEISLEGETLTVRGEIKRDASDNRKYVLLERPTGRFERTLTISTPIEHDKVEATFKDGVLTLTMPKAETVKPRQISVKRGD